MGASLKVDRRAIGIALARVLVADLRRVLPEANPVKKAAPKKLSIVKR